MNCCPGIGKSSRAWRTAQREDQKAVGLGGWLRDRRRLRKRYGKLREHLFTFLDHPAVTADNNGSERELRPTAT